MDKMCVRVVMSLKKIFLMISIKYTVNSKITHDGAFQYNCYFKIRNQNDIKHTLLISDQ